MASTTRQCDLCRQPYKPPPINTRPGSIVRGFCPPCTARNLAAWQARKETRA